VNVKVVGVIDLSCQYVLIEVKNACLSKGYATQLEIDKSYKNQMDKKVSNKKTFKKLRKTVATIMTEGS
jgi:hypothetical protein